MAASTQQKQAPLSLSCWDTHAGPPKIAVQSFSILSAHFGLGRVQDVKPIFQSTEYLEWLVHGSKATAILRGCTRPLGRHADVLHFLNEQSKRPSLTLPPLAAPLPAATGDSKGESFTTSREGFYFFATAAIKEGRDFKYDVIDPLAPKDGAAQKVPSPAEAFLAGRAVAQMHAGVTCPELLETLDLEPLKRHLEALREAGDSDGFAAKALPLLEALNVGLMKNEALEQGFVHNGVRRHWFTFAKSGALIHLDGFAAASKGPLVSDLGGLLVSFAMPMMYQPWGEFDGKSPPAIDDNCAAAVLMGYSSVRELSSADLGGVQAATCLALLVQACSAMRLHIKCVEEYLKFAANAFLSAAELVLDQSEFTLPAYLVSRATHSSFSHEIFPRALSSTIIQGDGPSQNNLIYLNGASCTPLPVTASEAGSDGVKKQITPWQVPGGEAEAEELRCLVGQLLGAPFSAENVALVPSTSYGMSIAAAAVVRKAQMDASWAEMRCKVVVLQDQNASNVLPWQKALETIDNGSIVPVDVCSAPVEALASPFWATERLAEAIKANDKPEEGANSNGIHTQSRILAVAIPHCHWSDGSLLDLESIAALCNERDIPMCLDLTQSVGAVDLSKEKLLEKIRPAFIACSGHKWLYGAYGLGFLAVSDEWLPITKPLEYHARQLKDGYSRGWDEFGTMDPVTGMYPTDPRAGARRLDSGSRPNPILVPILTKSLECVMRSWTPEKLHRAALPLTCRIASAAKVPEAMPFDVIELLDLLKNLGFHISVRCRALRISVSVFNTMEEVEDFCAALITETMKLKSRKLSKLPSADGTDSTLRESENGNSRRVEAANGGRKVPIWRDIMMF